MDVIQPSLLYVLSYFLFYCKNQLYRWQNLYSIHHHIIETWHNRQINHNLFSCFVFFSSDSAHYTLLLLRMLTSSTFIYLPYDSRTSIKRSNWNVIILFLWFIFIIYRQYYSFLYQIFPLKNKRQSTFLINFLLKYLQQQ